jgi:hypothetical protein
MLEKKIVVLFVLILMLPSLVSAKVSCKDCKINQCICTITDCDSGILDIFSGSSCGINPDYEFTFSNGYLEWNPKVAKSYYVKAFCSDGETQSSCDSITVRSIEEATTTTTKPTTTTTQPAAPAEGPDYLLLGLIGILAVAILLAAYYLFFRKKAGKSYEQLYRKWRK